MLAYMPSPLTIRPAPPDRQVAALGLLFSSLSPHEKAAQMSLTLAAVRERSVSCEGLLVAERNNQVAGVVWASPLGGKSALVWPPQIAADEAESTAGELLHASERWMRSHEVDLATAYLVMEESLEAQRLRNGGYHQAAIIAYLLSETPQFPDLAPNTRVEFVGVTNDQWPRLTAIVDATYEHTRDCPSLNGLRDTRDVLEGYRSSCAYSPAHWLIARHEDQDIGVLLMADHQQLQQLELVYMGVVPAARGRGFGTEITRHAQWLTRCAGRASLVLAVDAENFPAMRGYVACGFSEWDRRRVFLKSLQR
jgi:ribosomal protein S18 acetylase RimI-like enzyme